MNGKKIAKKMNYNSQIPFLAVSVSKQIENMKTMETYMLNILLRSKETEKEVLC